MSKDYTEKHESFGLVQLHRIQGNADFFGSRLKNHGTYISLKIVEGARYHDLHQDWYHGGNTIIEVRMTNAQFVQMITTMNMGPGVPCTIEHGFTEGFKQMEPVPKTHMSEAEHIRKNFKKDTKEFVDKLKGMVAEASEVMSKKSLSKKDREKVMWILRSALQEMESNLPFRVRSFEEATEKVTTEAKLEIEAFVVEAAMRTGLEQIKKLALKEAEPERDEYMDMLAEGWDPNEEEDR